MEKLAGHLGEHLPPSVLYYDDIERIVGIFEESNSEVTIQAKDYMLTSVKELKDLKESMIRELSIGCAKPSVSISFSPQHIWLYSHEDCPAAKGIFEKVKQFVISRRSRLAWLTDSSVTAGCVLGTSTWLLPNVLVRDVNQSTYLFFGLIILGSLMMWRSIRNLKRHSTIYPLQERHLLTGFFARNTDKIIIAIITAIVTTIVNRLLK